MIDGGKMDIYGYLLVLSWNQIALNRFLPCFWKNNII